MCHIMTQRYHVLCSTKSGQVRSCPGRNWGIGLRGRGGGRPRCQCCFASGILALSLPPTIASRAQPWLSPSEIRDVL